MTKMTKQSSEVVATLKKSWISRGSHSAVVVDAVDFPTNENSDPAVAPLLPVGQQVGDQQSQAWNTQ